MDGRKGFIMYSGWTRRHGLVILALWLGYSSPVPHIRAEQAPAIAPSDAYSEQAEKTGWSETPFLDDAAAARSCGCCGPGWYVQADYLNWEPHRTGLGVAILDPAGLGVPSSGGAVQALALGRDSGLRVALGRRTVTGWDVGFRYTHFSTDNHLTFAPGGGQVLALLSSPASGLTNADSVDATAGLELNVYDLEAGRWLRFGDSVSSRVSLGLRYAQIDQHLQARYDGGFFSNGVVDAPTAFEGFGGRLAGAVYWDLAGGFSVFGDLGLSLLAGELRSDRYEENFGTTVVDATNELEQVIPVVELSVGGAWSRGPWTLAAGYELSNWFNVATTTNFVDNFNGGSLDAGTSDLGFDGFFLRLAYVR